MDESNLDQDRPYCVVERNQFGADEFYCWTGQSELEHPTSFNVNLRVRFKQNLLRIRFGRKKAIYVVDASPGIGAFLLVRQ